MTSATNKAIARELRSVARAICRDAADCELLAEGCARQINYDWYAAKAIAFRDAAAICNRRASKLTAKVKKKARKAK